MSSRLSRRLAAFLCTSLLALTVLAGMLVTLPSGLAGSADWPPGPYKTASMSAFNPQPDQPGKIAGVIIHEASGDGVIVHD